MGARSSRLIDTALNFLVQQIHAIWQNKDGMATLLILDMTGAFGKVVPAHLLHNMRITKMPERIVKGVGSFISNRTTSLCLPSYNIDAILTNTSIPQDLSLSLILFIFYSANFVNACNYPTLPTLGISF